MLLAYSKITVGIRFTITPWYRYTMVVITKLVGTYTYTILTNYKTIVFKYKVMLPE